jgi:flagellar basal body rod protein FlgG
MTSAQQLLDIVAHNLANVSTNGFKREAAVFNDTLQRAMYADDGRYIGQLGTGGWMQDHYVDMAVGNATVTGNPLDVAILGEKGFFAVQTPNGVRYTRDGSFAINQDRQLTTHDGKPVLDGGGREITLPAGEVRIDGTGNVVVDGQQVAQIGVYDGAVTKMGEGLYQGASMKPVDEPLVQSGAVEGSNVNAIEEMIAMIQLNRIFEMAQRGAQSQDEMTQKLLSSIQGR